MVKRNGREHMYMTGRDCGPCPGLCLGPGHGPAQGFGSGPGPDLGLRLEAE